jgi:hypothetical protein
MVRRLSAHGLAAYVVVAALCLVGAGCKPATYDGVMRVMPPPVRTQAELTAMLLRLQDLPSGYTLQPGTPEPPDDADSATGGQGGGVAPCAEVLDQLRGGEPALSATASGTAEVEFSKGDYGPFLQQGLLSTADRPGLRAAVDTFRQLPTLCGEYTESDEQGSFTIRLSAVASFPSLGDETVALKLDAAGRSEEINVSLGGYVVLIRVGSTVCILIHFGIPGVEVAETEKVAAAAAARLR